MSATLRDVARLAGVHTATAARALSASGRDKVAAATRAKVEAAARSLGYTANATAASLRTGRSGVVGMLVPDIANPLFAPMLQGAERRLRESGWTLLLAQADPSDANRLALLQTLLERRVDGLIVASSLTEDPVLDLLHARGVPTVLVNRGMGERRFSSVVNDDAQSMQLAVAHLRGLGHAHLLHLAGPRNSSTGRSREAAFRQFAQSRAEVVVAGHYTIEAGRQAMQAYLARPAARRTASGIVAANDLIALGAIEAIEAAGARVPRDFSVVGHNDTGFMDRVDPPLTTVRLAIGSMGAQAAELLIQLMQSPAAQRPSPSTRLLHPELVVRSSTARVTSRVR